MTQNKENNCTCAICGDMFYLKPSSIKRGRGKTCSKKHHGEYMSRWLKQNHPKHKNFRLIPVECAFCGTIKEVTPSQFKRNTNFFCDKICKGLWQRTNLIRDSNPYYNPAKHTLGYCANCGKSIQYDANRKVKHGHFCGSECRAAYVGKQHIKEKSPRYNSKPVVCTYCGKTILRQAYRIDKQDNHFCDRKCLDTWAVGENAAGWNGGTSFEPYCPKFNKEFKTRVRAFFGYTCAECGMSEEENGKALGVHHVIYNKNTCCDSTTPLFVPLCVHCHSKTNSRREYWQTHFTELINTKYGGKCYYTKEEWAALTGEPSPALPRQIYTDRQPAAAQSH